MQNLRRCLVAVAVAAALPSRLCAADLTLGLNYPGAAIGVRSRHWALEIRAQSANDTDLLGLRVNRLFPLAGDRHLVYVGAEGAGFEHADGSTGVETGGVLAGAYVGIETFVTGRMSLAVDAGPYYASADDAGISESIADFVANVSLNLHWRGRTR